MKRLGLLVLICFWSLIGHAEAQEIIPLQPLIDQTKANGELILDAAIYEGNVVISKPITIKGKKGRLSKEIRRVMSSKSEVTLLYWIHFQWKEAEWTEVRMKNIRQSVS